MLAWVMMAWLAVPQGAAAVAPAPIETAHLTAAVSAGAAKAGKAPLHVDVRPRENMHVYAPGQPGYIAVTLTLDAGAPAAAVGKATFPAGEKYFMAALNETQIVYSRPFRITQDVRVKDGAPAGPVTITGTLRYQACDDKICYRPVTVPLTWTVRR